MRVFAGTSLLVAVLSIGCSSGGDSGGGSGGAGSGGMAGYGGGSNWYCGTLTPGVQCNCHESFHGNPTDNCNSTTYGADTLCCYNPEAKLCFCSLVTCRQGPSTCRCGPGLTDEDGAIVSSCSGTYICDDPGVSCWGADLCPVGHEISSCDVGVVKKCSEGYQPVSDCASAPTTN